MGSAPLKISDIISTEYGDFLEYCADAGKVFVSELNPVDFVAFRTRYAQSREYIKTIKSLIENPVIISTPPATEETVSVETTSTKSDEGYYSIEPVKLSQDDIPVCLLGDNFQTEQGVKDENTNQDLNPIDNHTSEVIQALEEDADEELEEDVTTQNEEIVGADEPAETTAGATKDFTKVRQGNNQRALASILDVDESLFSHVRIEELNLSVRATNCLSRAKLKTLQSVLMLSLEDLQRVKQMGAKTVDEVMLKVKEYVSSPSNIDVSTIRRDRIDQPIKQIPVDRYFKAAVDALLAGEEYSTDLMNEAQRERFEQLKVAVSEVGPEICIEAYTNPQYSILVSDALLDFSAEYIYADSVFHEVSDRLNGLSHIKLSDRVQPFIKAFSPGERRKADLLLSKVNDGTTFADILSILKKSVYEDKFEELAEETIKLLCWLDVDVNAIVNAVSESIINRVSEKDERALEIFRLRIKGKTLEELGNQYGLTRERIRQLEKKVFRVFWTIFPRQKYDLILLTYALRDGDSVLYFEELHSVIGQFAEVVWACIKHDPSHSYYYYSKDLDAIVIRSKAINGLEASELFAEVQKAINSLPELIPEWQKASQLEELAKKKQLPLEILEKIFGETYHISGVYYHCSYLTVSRMCSIVLKDRFPAGFKIADEFEANRFRQYLHEMFGERAANISNRALDAKIGSIGVLCDRGKYIHPDFLQIEPYVIEKVNSFVESSSRAVLPYGEVYEALQDVFSGTQITNRFLLQGALKKYGCRFGTGRDFIRKTQSVTFVDELESFVEERGIVHKSEIFAEFSSLGEASLGQVVARSANVFNIEGGYYIHASQFDIQPQDYEYLRQYLTEACREIPVNIRSVYETLTTQYPQFMYRNDFDDRNRLFAALNYMFRNEFNFSRPYIAKLGVSDVTNRSVILQYIEDYDSIEIDDLIGICEEHNINFIAVSYLIQSLAPDFMRINNTTLMRRELTGITEDVIEQAADIISDMLISNDYIVGSKIKDYLWFPQIDVDWNEFLLEGLIIQSRKINIVNLVGDPLKHPNAVYVSDLYKNDTYDSMLIKILIDEVHQGMFSSKVKMRNWLRKEGFIENKLPKFLESTKYFYANKTGVHVTGD